MTIIGFQNKKHLLFFTHVCLGIKERCIQLRKRMLLTRLIGL